MLRDEFNAQLEVTGVILPKIDGDTVVVRPYLSAKSLETNQVHWYWRKDYRY